MSSIANASLVVVPKAADKVVKRRPARGGTWWRHALGLLALVWALFPIIFLVSAALNPAGSLSTSSLIPKDVSLGNFDVLFSDASRPYVAWYKNAMIIAGVGALGSVFLGSSAAYAFSRMRFAGRRPGLLALLLLQMFPAMLTFTALYITFAKVGDVIPLFGLCLGHPAQQPEQKPRLPRALVVHENRYPETLDRALLAQYDSQIHDYYLARSSNNKVQTWSGQIKAILGKEARPFMLGFLQSKGFCLK